MITYVQAKYIAEDEENSDYHRGQTYFLEVRQHWFGKISVRPTHGYHFKPLNDMRCAYHNLEAFLKVWKIVQVAKPAI